MLVVWVLVSVGFAAILWSSLRDDTTSSDGIRGGELDPVEQASRDVQPERLAWTRAFERFDGTDGTLADYGEKPIVVNFWASTCVPCVAEMPEFEEVHQMMKNDVVFIGFNVSDRIEDGRRLADQTGVTYDLARDPDGSILGSFGGVAMPTTVLIDEDGDVAYRRSGQISATQLTDLINEELLS